MHPIDYCNCPIIDRSAEPRSLFTQDFAFRLLLEERGTQFLFRTLVLGDPSGLNPNGIEPNGIEPTGLNPHGIEPARD